MIRFKGVRRFFVMWVMMGFVAAGAYAEDAGPRNREELLDRDDDGRKETKMVYEGSVPIREEIDRNGDGEIDDLIMYERGTRFLQKRDQDFDGRYDRWYFYDSKGVMRRRSSDKNGDGKPDSWFFMEKGRQLVLKEYDRNFDGKVDRRQLDSWQMDRVIKSMRYLYVWLESDDDFDGTIDTYRVRGQKEPDPDKTGQAINTDFKKISARNEDAGANRSVFWDIREVVENRAELEELR